METKDIILELRTSAGMTQDALAERLFVTRQAVSRWENGETVPNVDTLKALSRLFDVSINTILGSPQKLICQCCGMPLDDGTISREPTGEFNEEYCKWCYTDGVFAYKTMDELLDYLSSHLSNPDFPPDEARKYFARQLPQLRYWSSPSDPETVRGAFAKMLPLLFDEMLGYIDKLTEKTTPIGAAECFFGDNLPVLTDDLIGNRGNIHDRMTWEPIHLELVRLTERMLGRWRAVLPEYSMTPGEAHEIFEINRTSLINFET